MTIGATADEVVDVADFAQLAGTLQVCLEEEYVLQTEDSFAIVTEHALTDELLLEDLAGAMISLAQRSTTSLVPAVASGIDDDYNNDGVVNLAGFYRLARSLRGLAESLLNDSHLGPLGNEQYGQ